MNECSLTLTERRRMTSAELRYIIAVDELYGGGRGARLTDVALKMGVTKVSVYKMFERLECRGLMERNALNRIFLTDSGRAELAVNMFCIDYIGKAIEKFCRMKYTEAFKEAVNTVCALSEPCRAALFGYLKEKRDE